jgi:soluble lytic murein transglycosylase
VEPRTHRPAGRKKHKAKKQTAIYVERLPKNQRLVWVISALIGAIFFVGAGAAAMHSSRFVAYMPNRFITVADAAGLVPLMPWTPHKDGELEQFEDTRLQLIAPDGALPLEARDLVREVMLQRARMPKEDAIRTADTIAHETKLLGIDPLLVLAIIDVESKFDHEAVSYRGARGLMQLMPDTRAWLIEKTPELIDEAERDDTTDPSSNVRVGIHYFASLRRGFRGLDHALQAYNCGPGRVVSIMRGESVLPEESKYYADRVQKSYDKLRRDYAYLSGKKRA